MGVRKGTVPTVLLAGGPAAEQWVQPLHDPLTMHAHTSLQVCS